VEWSFRQGNHNHIGQSKEVFHERGDNPVVISSKSKQHGLGKVKVKRI